MYALSGEMYCVDTGATVKFKNVLARVEDTLQVPPDGMPAGLTDQRVSKIAMVRGGCMIPVGLRRSCAG